MVKKNGIIRVEGYLPGPRWRDSPSLFADPFLDFALTQASQTWRERAIIRLNIVQREKAMLAELTRPADRAEQPRRAFLAHEQLLAGRRVYPGRGRSSLPERGGKHECHVPYLS
jgi:hypothetical protein